jgi:hypothetical protein
MSKLLAKGILIKKIKSKVLHNVSAMIRRLAKLGGDTRGPDSALKSPTSPLTPHLKDPNFFLYLPLTHHLPTITDNNYLA